MTVADEPLPLQALPSELRKLVLVQWVHVLCSTELGTSGFSQGDGAWGFRREKDGAELSLRFAGDDLEVIVEASGFDEREVQRIIERARKRTERGDFGEDVCYRSTMTSQQPNMDTFKYGHYIRLLGTQVVISGTRRLSDRVLFDFSAKDVDEDNPSLFAPSHTIETFIFVPGQLPGPLSSQLAHNILEIARLICTFALNRPVIADWTIFPAHAPELDIAVERKSQPEILGLARESVSLDVFGEFLSLGGPESVPKQAIACGLRRSHRAEESGRRYDPTRFRN